MEVKCSNCGWIPDVFMPIALKQKDRHCGRCSSIGTMEEILTIKKDKNTDVKLKPEQYRVGIDTFSRMKSNMEIDGIMAATVATVDAYIWRNKGSDYEDFCKARDWLNFCIEAMEENR